MQAKSSKSKSFASHFSLGPEIRPRLRGQTEGVGTGRRGHYERGLFNGGISRLSKISRFSRISREWLDTSLFPQHLRFSAGSCGFLRL